MSDEERRKAEADLMAYGTGALFIGADGEIRHVPIEELPRDPPLLAEIWRSIDKANARIARMIEGMDGPVTVRPRRK